MKSLGTPIRAYLVRRSDHPPFRTLPPVHRRSEFNLGRRFHAVLNRALLEVTKPEGLTLVEPVVFASLHDIPNIDERRLSERIGVDLASTQHMVRHLELRGFVSRTRGKRGSEIRLLSLTPAGLDLLERLHPAILAVRDQVMASLSERERETLQDLLARVINTNELKASRRFSCPTLKQAV